MRPLAALVLLPLVATPARAQTSAEPPNAPATVAVSDDRLVLRYQERVLFDATIAATGASPSFRQFTDSAGGAVTQVLKWTARGTGRPTITGLVPGSPEAVAAESEPREDGRPVVRQASGSVINRLNRAVYDRRSDWVLSVDVPAQVQLVPVAGAD